MNGWEASGCFRFNHKILVLKLIEPKNLYIHTHTLTQKHYGMLFYCRFQTIRNEKMKSCAQAITKEITIKINL